MENSDDDSTPTIGLLTRYVEAIQSAAEIVALDVLALQRVLVRKGLATEQEINSIRRETGAEMAVEELFDSRFQELERLRKLIEGKEG